MSTVADGGTSTKRTQSASLINCSYIDQVVRLLPPLECLILQPPPSLQLDTHTLSPQGISPVASTLPPASTTSTRPPGPFREAYKGLWLAVLFSVVAIATGYILHEKLGWTLSLSYGDVMTPDYALATTGGRVIADLTFTSFGATHQRNLEPKGYKSPLVALTPDTAPGNCWPMAGSSGQLGIHLSQTIYVTSFTIEHPPKVILPDPSSAPRRFSVWALFDKLPNTVPERHEPRLRSSQFPRTKPFQPVHLGTFTYSIHARTSVQSFPLTKQIREMNLPVAAVLFNFEDNWGSRDVTCIYRVRVHGTPVLETSASSR